MTAAISVRGLVHRYPTALANALDGLDLEVTPGERVALLGPNGSGKTTLALHLNGLLPTQAGSVEVLGLPVVDAHLSEIRQRVGLVFQDADDQLFMATVQDDVAFGPANLGVPADRRTEVVHDALAAVDATHLADRNPHRLSGGEKRRAAIATVLSMEPEIVVLDEPTSGLDPVGRRELAEVLRRLPGTLVVVTHDLPFALATCDRSVIIDAGCVVADGPTFDILDDAALLAHHRLELPFGLTLHRP